MTTVGVVATKIQDLRQALTRHGVKSSWGKLRVTGLDEKSLAVTVETSNYMFYQQFKTAKLQVPLLELLRREDMSLGAEDRAAVIELQRTIQREAERAEEERLAHEEAKRIEDERLRRRVEADRRSREAGKKRTEERRAKRDREDSLRHLVTAIGFPADDLRKDYADLSRALDQAPTLANAYKLAIQHALHTRSERATRILAEAQKQHRDGAMDAEALKAVAREEVSLPDPYEMPAGADAGLVAAAWHMAVERGDIGVAPLKASSSARKLCLHFARALHWPKGHPARPAGDSAAVALYNLRLKSQLLKDSTYRGENYLEEGRRRGDPHLEAIGHNNLALTYLCRGLHDDVAGAVKSAQAFLETAASGSEPSDELRRTWGVTEFLGAWTRLILDEDAEGACEAAVRAFDRWPGLAQAEDEWSVIVYSTDPHVRARLLAPYLAALAARLEASSHPGASMVRRFDRELAAGSVAGESAE